MPWLEKSSTIQKAHSEICENPIYYAELLQQKQSPAIISQTCPMPCCGHGREVKDRLNIYLLRLMLHHFRKLNPCLRS